MTSEDYSLLEIAISCFVLCRDCICFKGGICTRLKTANVDYNNGMLMCSEADGCTFGAVREDEEE